MDSFFINVFIVVIIIFIILFFINIYQIKYGKPIPPKPQLKEVVTIETMSNPNPTNLDLGLDFNPLNSFCKSHTGSSDKLNISCGKLTNANCNAVDCCVLLNSNKCVAGSIDGPTYQTTPDGKNINIDYYYYHNKCYGKGCSTS
jgi:hypothetical protein